MLFRLKLHKIKPFCSNCLSLKTSDFIFQIIRERIQDELCLRKFFECLNLLQMRYPALLG